MASNWWPTKRSNIEDAKLATINALKKESSGLAFHFLAVKSTVFTMKDIKTTIIDMGQLHSAPIKGGSAGPHIDKEKSKILLTKTQNESKSNKSSKSYCSFCKQDSHNTKDCRSKKKAEAKKDNADSGKESSA